ncbi:hypothetical protein A1S_3724 [Acinetobacter baumannii ATCC 17978]|jgi:hypothetical protein|nr:hypothetical protein A1S_3724 [Acinetobacter baumannii ATCC 17978]
MKSPEYSGLFKLLYKDRDIYIIIGRMAVHPDK